MKEIMITSSVLILCIMLIRLIFKGKISSRLQYALWLLVALRLVVPSSAQIGMAIGSIDEFRVMDLVELLEIQMGDVTESLERPVGFTMSLEGGLGDLMAEWMLGKDADLGVPGYDDGATSVFLAGRAGFCWIDVLRGIWIGGMLVVALWMIMTNFLFGRRLRKGRREFALPVGSEPGEIQNSIGINHEETQSRNSGSSHGIKGRSGRRRGLKIYVVEDLASPCLYGFPGREAVYLTPDVAESEKRLQHVLTHEMCHKKHGDSFWSILRSILVAVYWMNPLVWAAAVLSKRDCELACDEAALMELGEEQRIPYGETLLSIITKRGRLSDFACTATTMTGGGRSVKERIRFIAEKPRILGAAVVASLLLILIISVLVFTKSPRYSGGTWEQGDAVVISGELMVRLPETIAGIGGYQIEENSEDILVYQVSSGREAGRFRALSYGEAVMLAEEGREIVPLGNYGRNSYLLQYMGLMNGDDLMGVTQHSYSLSDDVPHTYTPNDAESGIPGTDSNMESVSLINDETTYILEESESAGASESANPAPDQAADGQPEEIAVDYLPNEQIVTTSIPAGGSSELCYVYVKADYTKVRDIYLDEMEYINRELEEAADQAVILSANREIGEETFVTLAKNRTEYLGDASKVSALVNALSWPDGLAYTGIELHTGSDTVLALDINYEMTADSWEDVDTGLMYVNAMMLFASIGNLEKCNFMINGSLDEMKADGGSQSSDKAAAEEGSAGMLGHYETVKVESVSYERADLEKEWGSFGVGEVSEDEKAFAERLKGLYARAAANFGNK